MGLLCSCLKPPLKAVEKVDVNQMLGTWYVIAVVPTPFEKGGFNSTEKYTWDGKRKRIDVDFTLNQGSIDGPVKSIPQKIYVPSYPISTGKWLASPVWPVKLDYTIMSLAEDYSWVVVGHRSRKWFWVMSRETSLEDGPLQAALALGRENGFPMAKLEYPKHRAPADATPPPDAVEGGEVAAPSQ